MIIPVFRSGSFLSYTVPSDVEHIWSMRHKLIAASVYATALSKGHTPSQSAIYAEMYINKQLYPGMQYRKEIETILDSFLV